MRNRIVTLMLIFASTPALSLDATPLFSVYAGAGSWISEYSGEIGSLGETANFDELGFDDENNTYLYVAFEHALPFIPQVRLETIDLGSSGLGTLAQTFTIGDETFTVGSEVDTDLDLSFIDATLYYELAIFDFGLTLRQFEAEASAVSTADSSLADSEKVDGVLPLVYLQTKIDLPLTGLYLTGSANAISFDDKSVTDFRAAVGYGIELSFIAEIGLELGYRSFEIDLGEDEDLVGDIELSGAYFGANVKF